MKPYEHTLFYTFGGIKYTVKATADETVAEFIVKQEGDWDPLIEGHVKWDGCSNWMIGGNCMFHACDKQGFKDLAYLLGALYDWAGENIERADFPEEVAP